MTSRFFLRMRFACVCTLTFALIFNAFIQVGDTLALGTITYLLLCIVLTVGALGGELALRREWRRQSKKDFPHGG